MDSEMRLHGLEHQLRIAGRLNVARLSALPVAAAALVFGGFAGPAVSLGVPLLAAAVVVGARQYNRAHLPRWREGLARLYAQGGIGHGRFTELSFRVNRLDSESIQSNSGPTRSRRAGRPTEPPARATAEV